MHRSHLFEVDLRSAVMDIIPSPILVKDADLKYVWVNQAFERMFSVRRDDLIGQSGTDVFRERQTAQCNGGDLRVLTTGDIDEAHETVFAADGRPLETITRKSRLTLPSGKMFLVGVMHDITEMVEQNTELEKARCNLQAQADEMARLAETDSLTGCKNGRALFDLARTASYGGAGVGILKLDLDNFKTINDTYGHDVGDAALVHFCDVVRTRLRPKDELVRLGGEEFAVFLPETAIEFVTQIGERIVSSTAAQPVQIDGNDPIQITVSVGGGWVAPDLRGDFTDTLRQADKATYLAKTRGRNQFVMATDSASI